MVNSLFMRGLKALALAVLAGGCGPTVQSSLPPHTSIPATLALLPSDYSIDIPRERISLVRQAMINELRNRNFVVLDDSATTSLCSSPACPEQKELADRYLVDGFATLTLSSFSRNNFLAGYYNELSGNLSIADRSGKQLISVSNTQNEEGGLLLQSGQIFQAIISSVKNTGDSAFETLADKFAENVVSELPRPSVSGVQLAPEGTSVALSSASATWAGPTSFTLCATGTPHSFAYLVTPKARTTLREISPGRYCATLSSLVSISMNESSSVELRSAFGTSVRQEVQLPSKPPCDLRDRVQLGAGKVTLACTQVGTQGAPLEGCPQNLSPCTTEKVVLFKAVSPQGPFEKVAESRSAQTSVPGDATSVHVLAIGKGGVPSLPVPAEIR